MVVEEMVVEVVVVVALWRPGTCGSALPNVRMILYSPFHDFISRSIRSTLSMRRMRRNERLAPPPLASTVIPRSTADSSTIVLWRKAAVSRRKGAAAGRRGGGGARG